MIRSSGPESNPEVVIHCESNTCETTQGDCCAWHHGMPCWHFPKRKWLAQTVNWAND